MWQQVRVSRGAAAALLLAVILLPCCAKDTRHEPAEVRHEFLNQDPSVQYVGRQACRMCHLDIHTSYASTGMGQSFYPLTAENAVEDFERHNEVEIENSNLTYRMARRGGKFYQRQFVLDTSGAETAVDEHELVYVVGSNSHSRSYIVQLDGKLFQAPVCWYPQASRWDLCPGFEGKNSHFSREISSSCLFCHNGRVDPVEGERNQFKEPIPHGIDCERCHGPGQLHVERWAHGDDLPTGEVDRTIVNPRRLPVAARMEICFQCHLGEASTVERVARVGRSSEDFRPGDRFHEVLVPFRFAQKLPDEFGLSAQADRLLLSPCYLESAGKMECLTCHDPHLTVYREDRPADHFRQACLSCHATEDCAAPMEHRQKTQPADDCVACHMRTAEPDDQRYTEFTDHWIRRDITPRDRAHRESHEMEPMFPELVASMPKQEQHYYRARAVFLKAHEADAGSRPAMWAAAERDFQAAIEQGLDTADAWFFLAKTQLEMKRTPLAISSLEQAVRRDPAHRDAAFALAQTLAAQGQPARALELYQGMLGRDPDDPMALAETGRIHFAQRRTAEALAAFDRALRKEPWSTTLHLNRGMTLAALGRFDEAAHEAREVVRLDPDNVKSWEFYARVMDAAGRKSDAAEGNRQLERLQKSLARAEPGRSSRPS